MSRRARAMAAKAAGGKLPSPGPLSDECLLDVSDMTFTVAPVSIAVADSEAGERLDRVLARHVASLSRSRLKALIEHGAVTIEGRTISDPNHRVNRAATITLALPPPEPAVPAAEPMALNVVYEDDDIIVIDKPRGLVVHPAAGHWGGTLVNALIAHCGDSLSGIGGVRRPGIVHRLDKDTTGLMVVAKNDHAHRVLAEQLAARTTGSGGGALFERGYLAFVWGAPTRDSGTIDQPIARHPQVRERMAVAPGGRRAITHWQVLERYAGRKAGSGTKRESPASKPEPVASLLACRLETGRTHQIRVHLAAIGHPLMGDSRYGAAFRTKSALLPPQAQAALNDLGRQALHAYMLHVTHPSSGKVLTFRSELPADLRRLHDALLAGR
jgi:23S rRNA pseudouridine1911/1915/1917 synthase